MLPRTENTKHYLTRPGNSKSYLFYLDFGCCACVLGRQDTRLIDIGSTKVPRFFFLDKQTKEISCYNVINFYKLILMVALSVFSTNLLFDFIRCGLCFPLCCQLNYSDYFYE